MLCISPVNPHLTPPTYIPSAHGLQVRGAPWHSVHRPPAGRFADTIVSNSPELPGPASPAHACCSSLYKCKVICKLVNSVNSANWSFNYWQTGLTVLVLGEENHFQVLQACPPLYSIQCFDVHLHSPTFPINTKVSEIQESAFILWEDQWLPP